MSEKRTQERIVYDIMAIICPARTEQIKLEAMRRGVSCADRYMRWLSDRGIVRNIGKVKDGDRTDTWEVIAPYSVATKEPLAQADMFPGGER